MAQADITFRIRTVDEDKEITISVPLDATFEDVAQQVREQKGWGDDTVVRLLCGGRELQPSQGVAGASSTVLHCVGTSGTLVRPADRSSYESKDSVADLQQDWLDVMDPGTVLMWIFGSILVLLWLLFLFYDDVRAHNTCGAHMFDRTSIIMLIMMTVAFLIPCTLAAMPSLRGMPGVHQPPGVIPMRGTSPLLGGGIYPPGPQAFMQQQQQQQQQQQGAGGMRSEAQLQQQQQQHAGGEVAWCASSAVPPRPQARRPPVL